MGEVGLVLSMEKREDEGEGEDMAAMETVCV